MWYEVWVLLLIWISLPPQADSAFNPVKLKSVADFTMLVCCPNIKSGCGRCIVALQCEVASWCCVVRLCDEFVSWRLRNKVASLFVYATVCMKKEKTLKEKVGREFSELCGSKLKFDHLDYKRTFTHVTSLYFTIYFLISLIFSHKLIILATPLRSSTGFNSWTFDL